MRLARQVAWAALLGSLCAPSIALCADPAKKPDAFTVDGGRYYGPLADGKLQGRGRLEWDNGDRYEGEFANGRFSGKGQFTRADGSLYEGEFRDGRMNGKGRLQMPDASVYVGEFRDDMFSGKGKLEAPGLYAYEGEFRHGSFEGQGHFSDRSGEYRGEFRHGRYSGQGESKMPDGSKYTGAFLHGNWNGKGRYENAGREVYEGDFVEGEFTGKGKYTRPDGSRYEGEFTRWLFNGAGKYTDPRTGVYEGRFVNGPMTGKGKFTGKDGTVYEGGFKDGVYDGQGELRLPNGDVYKGGFKHGMYGGKGTLTYARPIDGKTQASGDWAFGRLGEAGPENAEKNTEKALYNQRRLLEQSFAALAPADPQKPVMYLLAVAGDGSQEVFRREVDFVSKQFAGRFGTGKRTVALVNSRNTVETMPMATTTSIGDAIKAIAAKMDREKDILFVYLSSHGSAQHDLVLDQNGMDLPDLPAKDLAAMLRESGIRWKVLVVSACYAGGFINPAKDDGTLIIAAARYDRRSFGCADDNDFTYFGEAFFRDALPQSASFQEAFEKARVIVEKKETAHDNKGKPAEEDFSRPQMHNPAKAEQYLKKWWAQSVR